MKKKQKKRKQIAKAWSQLYVYMQTNYEKNNNKYTHVRYECNNNNNNGGGDNNDRKKRNVLNVNCM